jgi:hypothetical protein
LGDTYFESRSRDKRVAGLKRQLESLGLTVVLSNTA